MANLARVRIVWNGTAITGPGVTTMYFDEAGSGFVAAVQNWVASWKNYIPGATTMTVEGFGDLIDVATGALSGTWTDGTTLTQVGTFSGAFAAGVGARTVWDTAGVHNGRRVRGSSFIVPLGASLYDTDGTLAGATLTTLTGAATTLIGGSTYDMQIYSRPVGGAGGQASAVISSQVPDRVSWLRSRRT